MQKITHLFDGPQSPRCYLHSNVLLEGLGEQALVVDVRKPRPSSFVFREWYVVSRLLRLAPKKTQLSPFERRTDHLTEAQSGEHSGREEACNWALRIVAVE